MNHATSIEFWATETVRQMIETMADQRIFRPVGTDSIRSVKRTSVITRINRRPSADEARRKGERLNENPGFIITYNGHTRPPNAGENTCDDGIIKILVQLVDVGDDGDDTNLASYLRWMSDIREGLLTKHNSQLSPLEDCPLSLGQIYFVHVREAGPPDETDWGFHEDMRAASVVECYTRTSR